MEEKEIVCPYCGEFITILIDCTIAEQSYVEDCQICCQPILIDVSVARDSEIHVNARRENE